MDKECYPWLSSIYGKMALIIVPSSKKLTTCKHVVLTIIGKTAVP